MEKRYQRKTWESCCFSAKAIKRTDKDLIKIVEKLKEKSKYNMFFIKNN